jgi:hypothetical protein
MIDKSFTRFWRACLPYAGLSASRRKTILQIVSILNLLGRLDSYKPILNLQIPDTTKMVFIVGNYSQSIDHSGSCDQDVRVADQFASSVKIRIY